MAEEKGINIIYAALPDGTYSGCIENENKKLILIEEDIKGTNIEMEGIAQGLAYKMALDELKIKANIFNDDHKQNIELVNELAAKYKDDILTEIALAELHELIKDMTEEEKDQLINQCVDEMVKRRDSEKRYNFNER